MLFVRWARRVVRMHGSIHRASRVFDYVREFLLRRLGHLGHLASRGCHLLADCPEREFPSSALRARPDERGEECDGTSRGGARGTLRGGSRRGFRDGSRVRDDASESAFDVLHRLGGINLKSAAFGRGRVAIPPRRALRHHRRHRPPDEIPSLDRLLAHHRFSRPQPRGSKTAEDTLLAVTLRVHLLLRRRLDGVVIRVRVGNTRHRLFPQLAHVVLEPRVVESAAEHGEELVQRVRDAPQAHASREHLPSLRRGELLLPPRLKRRVPVILQVQRYHPPHPRLVHALALRHRGFEFDDEIGVEHLARGAFAAARRVRVRVRLRGAFPDRPRSALGVAESVGVSSHLLPEYFGDGHLRVAEQTQRVPTDANVGLVRLGTGTRRDAILRTRREDTRRQSRRLTKRGGRVLEAVFLIPVACLAVRAFGGGSGTGIGRLRRLRRREKRLLRRRRAE